MTSPGGLGLFSHYSSPQFKRRVVRLVGRLGQSAGSMNPEGRGGQVGRVNAGSAGNRLRSPTSPHGRLLPREGTADRRGCRWVAEFRREEEGLPVEGGPGGPAESLLLSRFWACFFLPVLVSVDNEGPNRVESEESRLLGRNGGGGRILTTSFPLELILDHPRSSRFVRFS